MKESLFWLAISSLTLAFWHVRCALRMLDEHFDGMMQDREELRDKEEVSI
jgi:hypothetical protein